MAKSKEISALDDNIAWLDHGIKGLSNNFEEVVPRAIRNEYMQRLKKDGVISDTFDYMEAVRAFRLYFILWEMDDQVMLLLTKMSKKMNNNNFKVDNMNKMVHLFRNFGEIQAKAHKVLSDILEKNGHTRVAKYSIGSSQNSVWQDIINQVDEMGAESDSFDMEFKIRSQKKKKNQANPNQSNLLLEDEKELSETEYAELAAPDETVED